MPITYPLVNGTKFDWASVEIELGEAGIFVGVKELSYSDSLEPGIVRGTGAEKLARTIGEYDAEGSMIMYTADRAAFLAALTNNGATGTMDTTFDITVTYSVAQGDGTQTDRLIGCRITNKEGGGSQGTDALEAPFDLDIMRIEEAGLLPITDMLT